jgi:type II secretion system protein H
MAMYARAPRGAFPSPAEAGEGQVEARMRTQCTHTQERNASIGRHLSDKMTWKPRQCLTFINGFTLIEILVVIAVLGIATVLATANLFQTDEEKLQQEAEKILTTLQVARDESAFGGRVIAATVTPGEMTFLERDFADPDRWRPSPIGPLSTRKLPEAFQLQLSVGAGGEDTRDAHITFLPIGVAAPFALTLRSPAGSRKISGDAIGNLALQRV